MPAAHGASSLIEVYENASAQQRSDAAAATADTAAASTLTEAAGPVLILG